MSGSLFFNSEEAEDAADFITRRTVAPQSVEDANAFMDAAEGAMDVTGMTDAVENLRRYRSNSGAARVFTTEEMDRYPEYSRAEDVNRTRFESRTFTARSGDQDKVNQRLLSLEDGQTVDFEDYWDSSLDTIPTSVDAAKRFMTFGRSGVRSGGRFTATRRGEDVDITGTVQHGFTPTKDYPTGQEAFDFNEVGAGSPQARVLERASQGAPFGMSYSRLQDVTAQLQRDPNGTLVLRRSTWGALR